MSRKHIIRILVNPHRNDCNYDVYGDAMEAILNDSEYSAPSNANLDTEEIFSRMRKLFSEYYEYALPVNRLYEELTDLVQNSPDSLFCQKIKEIEFDDAHYMVIFLYLCHRYASHGVGSMEVGRLLKLLDPKKDSKRIEREIMNEYTSLHYFGLVEFSSEDGLADTSKLSLTENVRKEFFTELDIRNEDAGVRNPDIKSHESIVGKRLFFNAAEREQMERLSSLLRDENFKEVQGRLAEQGLRKGVNILLYGPPGTGKTESCLPFDHCLLLDLDSGSLRTMALPKEYQDHPVSLWKLQIRDDGSALLTVRETVQGSAFGRTRKRYQWMTPEERRQHYAKLVSAISQDATPVTEDLTTDFRHYPGEISYAVNLAHCATMEGDFCYLTLPAALAAPLAYARAPRLFHPLYRPSFQSSEIHLEVELPPAYPRLLMAPADFLWKAPDGAGTIAWKKEADPAREGAPRRLRFTLSVDMAPGITTLHHYPQYQEAYRRLLHPDAVTLLLAR